MESQATQANTVKDPWPTKTWRRRFGLCDVCGDDAVTVTLCETHRREKQVRDRRRRIRRGAYPRFPGQIVQPTLRVLGFLISHPGARSLPEIQASTGVSTGHVSRIGGRLVRDGLAKGGRDKRGKGGKWVRTLRACVRFIPE